MNKVHGSFVGGLKLCELSIAIADIFAALLCVAGPTEPGDLQYILGPVREFFRRHDPGVPLARHRHSAHDSS